MPLDMPEQDLARAPQRPALITGGMAARRWLVMLGALVLALLSTGLTLDVLKPGGFSAAECVLLTLSFLLSLWIAFGFVTACAGFAALLGQPRRGLAPAPDAAFSGRIAVLMPVYNEDPAQILSAVQTMAEDLARVGARQRYDIYVLSDTRDDKLAAAEAAGVIRLRARMTHGAAVFYRRRVKNTDKKAGNVAEWVRTYGGGYDHMLVLDADSLMTAETILALAAEMDADPRLGLLQTVPAIINAETPFARLQQFANRLYGPIFSLGQAWWSGSEGNYWGHNAMIRVAAFAQSAGLPHLPGKRPFGGDIMSHDFVEAALLRRRGWAVRMAADLGGSFEETPPTLLDTAARDRRWCQGNLQHIRLLPAAGLHWISRLHMARGVLAYLAPMLWLVFLAGGAVVWPGEVLTSAMAKQEVLALFALTVAFLAIPKLLALGAVLADPAQRRTFGGGRRLLAGMAFETIVSTLTAPVTMVMQTVAVVQVLLGRDSGWSAQRREGGELTGREAWRAHRSHVLLGVGGALAALILDRYFLIWTSPVFLGLALSAFLSLRSSRSGRREGRPHQFLLTPEQIDRPTIIERARELRRQYAEEATVRRQLDQLFRLPVPVYGFEPPQVAPVAAPLPRRLAVAA
jgi:membrane glycosyltransferase